MSGTVVAPLIRVAGVSRAYRTDVESVWAARDVDFVARPGEFVCVYGASGSGKSTFLNLLAGLDTPESGRIEVAGTDISGSDEKTRAALRLHTVGMIFQDHNLIEEFTVAENVALPLEASGVPPERAREQALEQLARVRLEGLEKRFPRQLSGGQRQRVGIARALVGDRGILLADEPTGALDSTNTMEIFKLLRSLCDQGLLAVVCSHDIRCRDYADTAYEIVDGVFGQRP
ncbi:ABC transporter ATP-binding protein [Actinoplanes sp. RD1]|uniref:ABC transporter ATP-binding protein n=1 Tax=Actinoplanes sp. RD1 TaxID=3064538 RepID=UPI0027411DF3|nr:ABC transporter ATP-binding protein [Actinoplanes sp. RD1]